MTLQLRAFLYSAGILVGACIAGAALIQIFQMIPVAWLPWIGISLLIVVGFNVVYSVTLSQLHYENKLKEMLDQK